MALTLTQYGSALGAVTSHCGQQNCVKSLLSPGQASPTDAYNMHTLRIITTRNIDEASQHMSIYRFRKGYEVDKYLSFKTDTPLIRGTFKVLQTSKHKSGFAFFWFYLQPYRSCSKIGLRLLLQVFISEIWPLQFEQVVVLGGSASFSHRLFFATQIQGAGASFSEQATCSF